MERAAYSAMDAVERSHWWYVGRRKVLASLIDRNVSLPPNPRLLDAGCGTGGNLAFLAQLGELNACEYDSEARAIARQKAAVDIVPAAFPDDLTRVGKDFDLITLLDVLEHVEEDVATLRALGERLASDGRLLVTVPAIPQLWSAHDEVHHHLRRYTMNGLAQTIRASGLSIQAIGYFNSLLFPLAVVDRVVSRLRGRDEANLTMPPGWLNATLEKVFASEAVVLGYIRFPIGLSLYAVIGRQPILPMAPARDPPPSLPRHPS